MDRRDISARPSLCRAFSHLILCLSFCRHSQLYLRLLFRSKETGVPAVSQLIEQSVRIGSVFLIYFAAANEALPQMSPLPLSDWQPESSLPPSTCLHILISGKKESRRTVSPFSPFAADSPAFAPFTPAYRNRVLLNLLQSAEAVSIPLQLKAAGMTQKEALSVYGVLTGMALPCILFPSAITNSISTMLLPAVAEIQAGGSIKKLREVIRKVFFCCFALGLACCFAFLLFGQLAGELLFHSQMAGQFIITLAGYVPSSIQTALFLASSTDWEKPTFLFCLIQPDCFLGLPASFS